MKPVWTDTTPRDRPPLVEAVRERATTGTVLLAVLLALLGSIVG